jgi:hypothetical protein
LEINIKATLDYDFEKAQFFLAEFDVETSPKDRQANQRRNTPKEPCSNRDYDQSASK